MTRSHHAIPSVSVLATLSQVMLTATSASSVGASSRVRDAIPCTQNGAEPRDGIRAYRLEERWRAGGEDDDLFFGLVPRVDSDEEGNIYVLDTQLCHVHVYSPDGTLLRTVFREGEGPGEARGPRDMIVLPDGTVGLVLEERGMLAFVDANGVPAAGYRLGGPEGGIYSLVSGVGTSRGVILGGTRIHPGDVPEIRLRGNFLAAYDPDGNRYAVLAESHTTRDFRDFQFDERDDMPPFLWCFDATADGRVYAVTDRDQYLISVFNPDGTLARQISRQYHAFRRSEEDYRAFYGMIETANENLPIHLALHIARAHPAIEYLLRGLHVRDDGSLWVLTSRGARPSEPGVMAIFDVFDSTGVFTHQIALHAPHEGSRVAIVPVGEDRVVVVKGYLESLASQFGNGATFDERDGAWEHPEIICYEMAGL